jgi:hypothetical protein
MYKIPNKFYIRLHHSRPRFKNNIEDVLIFMANEICAIGPQPTDRFSNKLRGAIKSFPGNYNKSDKTIDNWRTEISSLLGLIEEQDNNTSRPSRMSEILNDKQDLIEFFRFFCLKFQYPGGHLKPKSSLEMIQQGVKFKPAQYLLRVLKEGNIRTNTSFGLSKEEATHCIFNDLRVVRDQRNTSDTVSLILQNRQQHTEYDCSGDIVRYAGDILDYMSLANLVSLKANNKYYLKTNEIEVLNALTSDNQYFPAYDKLYNQKGLTIEMVAKEQKEWFRYVNSSLDESVFHADIFEIINQSTCNSGGEPEQPFINELLNKIRTKQKTKGNIKTKEIGDVGEAISIQHEQTRLSGMDRADLAKKVIKLPEAYAVGYDINSFEGTAEIKRLIEVKTTISKNKLSINKFHMTPNEWGAAETFKDAYFIYRLMISTDDVSLFVIRNPVGQYKQDKLKMTPRNGADISYSGCSGFFEKVLS